MSFLALKNLSKSYGSGSNRTSVLKDINLEITEGEFVAIVGFSGSGKTTLISSIAGLIKPDSGEVIKKGKPISGLLCSRWFENCRHSSQALHSG